MTDQLGNLGFVLGVIASIVAALITGLNSKLSPRLLSILTCALGVAVAVVLHGWGFVPFIAQTGVEGIIYSGLLGLAASVMGHGVTAANVFNVFKPGA